MAGGYGKETMDGMTGGWADTGVSSWSSNFASGCYYHRFPGGCATRAVTGDYAYRNVANPFGPSNPGNPGDWQFGPNYTLPLRYVKPKIVHAWYNSAPNAGLPMFKTQKLQDARGVAGDFFGKVCTTPTTKPGPAAYYHGDGYNVLYGDWSVKWYGDPQRRIAFWPNPYMNGYFNNAFGGATVIQNVNLFWPATDNEPQWAWQDIWHLFDEANSMDAGNPI